VLENLLSEKRTAILERWFHLILDNYPSDTSSIFKLNKDRFTNPIGYTISRETKILYDELLHDMDTEKVATCLDNIVRIRSVQDFPPSQAIAFIFLLKKVIREELAGEIEEKQDLKQLSELESRIDELALLALDIYVQCREKVHQIVVDEVKTEREMALKLLERASVLHEDLEKE